MSFYQYNFVVWPAILWVCIHSSMNPKTLHIWRRGRDHAKLSQNRRVRPSLHQNQSLLGAFGAYFIANGVPADTGERFKRIATLISVIGSKAYDVLSDLCSPGAHSEKTYDDLATILKDHFALKKLLIAERYRFHNCIQLERESVYTFAAKLKHLASTCNLATSKLGSTWSFGFWTSQQGYPEKVVNRGTQFWRSSQESARRRTRRPPGKGWGKKPLKSTSECFSRRKTDHPRSQCKYRNNTCHTYGRSGHITDACTSKSQKIHTVGEPEESQPNLPQIHFLSQSSALTQRTKTSTYPLKWTESIS